MSNDQTCPVLGTNITLLILLQSKKEQGWRIIAANAKDRFHTLGHSLHKLDLVCPHDPATITFGNQMQRRVILIRNPVIPQLRITSVTRHGQAKEINQRMRSVHPISSVYPIAQVHTLSPKCTPKCMPSLSLIRPTCIYAFFSQV